MRKKITTDQFIERANNVHLGVYDYSSTILDGMKNKVSIICSEHGLFEQKAYNHLNGNGCSLCGDNQRRTKVCDFIERANIQHSNRFDYSQVVYVNTATKVDIICPEHGVFKQKPNDHLTGYGCTTCGGGKKITTGLFIERAHKVHEEFYNYAKTKMDGMNNKTTITCPFHGDFEQRPADHVNGAGCPICGTGKQGGYCEQYFENHPEAKVLPAQLYLITVDNTLCKIGITKKRYVKDRFPGMRFNVIDTKKMPLYEAYKREQGILNKFKSNRFKIKEFKSLKQTGWTECFPVTLLPELARELANG